MEIAVILLVGLFLYAASKWAIYKLSVMAILLYFAERGVDIPDVNTIQKYRMIVVKKLFHIKGD